MRARLFFLLLTAFQFALVLSVTDNIVLSVGGFRSITGFRAVAIDYKYKHARAFIVY